MTRRFLAKPARMASVVVAIEAIIRVEIGHVLVGLGIGRHLHVAVDAEYLPNRHLHVGQAGHLLHSLQSLLLRGFGTSKPDAVDRPDDGRTSKGRTRNRPDAPHFSMK